MDAFPRTFVSSFSGKVPDSRQSPALQPSSVQSVWLGWPVLALVMNTTRRASSGQYQIRPAPVTSYCHCSSTFPLMARVPRSLLNLCCLLGLVLSRGSRDRASHASRTGPGACRHSSSHPVAASDSPNRSSHSPPRAGGATRSPRLGIRGVKPWCGCREGNASGLLPAWGLHR
jgi:hypothetical protein